MRKLVIAATLASLAPSLAPALAQSVPSDSTAKREQEDSERQAKREREDAKRYRQRDLEDARIERERAMAVDRSGYSQYDYDRPDPHYGNYQADRYYYASSKYPPHRLYSSDRIYRGGDNRYYWRRSDGTTGLIVEGLESPTFGRTLAPGQSRTLGAMLDSARFLKDSAADDHGRVVICR